MSFTENTPLNKLNSCSQGVGKQSSIHSEDRSSDTDKDNSPKQHWTWTSPNPRNNLFVFVLQFIVIHGMIFAIIGVGLYNITISNKGRDYYISLVSTLIGIILPQPSTLKSNKVVFPFQGLGRGGS